MIPREIFSASRAHPYDIRMFANSFGSSWGMTRSNRVVCWIVTPKTNPESPVKPPRRSNPSCRVAILWRLHDNTADLCTQRTLNGFGPMMRLPSAE